MKSITLHRAAVDNVGGFQDAGTTLRVGDAAEAGQITADRARALIDSHGAEEEKVAAKGKGASSDGEATA